MNRLGTTLYQTLAAAQPTANVVLSPASIAIALAMVREGAAGITADEMDQVLGIEDLSALAPAMNALDQALAARTGTFPDASGSRPIEVVLRIVSALWGQEGLAWSADFLDRLAIDYGAGLRITDFEAESGPGTRDTINTWVRDETEQRVQEVLPPGSVDAATRMLLVNAVYLKAPWLTPFETAATADTAFTRLDGTAVTVPMMRSTSQLAYAAGNGWQAVDLPYGGYALTMTVLVPDAGRLAEVEAQVSPDLVDAVVATQALRSVDLGTAALGLRVGVLLERRPVRGRHAVGLRSGDRGLQRDARRGPRGRAPLPGRRAAPGQHQRRRGRDRGRGGHRGGHRGLVGARWRTGHPHRRPAHTCTSYATWRRAPWSSSAG